MSDTKKSMSGGTILAIVAVIVFTLMIVYFTVINPAALQTALGKPKQPGNTTGAGTKTNTGGGTSSNPLSSFINQLKSAFGGGGSGSGGGGGGGQQKGGGGGGFSGGAGGGNGGGGQQGNNQQPSSDNGQTAANNDATYADGSYTKNGVYYDKNNNAVGTVDDSGNIISNDGSNSILGNVQADDSGLPSGGPIAQYGGADYLNGGYDSTGVDQYGYTAQDIQDEQQSFDNTIAGDGSGSDNGIGG